MRFVHTYWTKPALADRWNVDKLPQIIGNIWYYSTSVAYLKKLGQYIELHTDDFGKTCLDHISYDNIYTDLNTVPKNIKPFMWAYGKFWGCKDIKEDYIHIDGDVFIKSQKTLDAIGYDNQVVVQGHEYVTNPKYKGALYSDISITLKNMEYPYWSNRTCQHAYNVGLLQISNKDIRKKYFDTYFKYAEYCCTDPIISKACSDSHGHLAPDLVFEQQWLYELTSYYKVPVKELLTSEYTGSTHLFSLSFCKSAENIGYQHIIGDSKYKDNIIYKCKCTLKQLDPTLFENTLRKVNYITKILNEK